MICKVHGKRFVYKFVCDLKQLLGYSASELSKLVEEAERRSINRSNSHLLSSFWFHESPPPTPTPTTLQTWMMLSNGRRAVAGLGRRVAVQGAQRLQTGNSSLIHSNPALSNREMAKPMGKDAAKVYGGRLRPWSMSIFSSPSTSNMEAVWSDPTQS